MRGSEHKILPMHMQRLPAQTKYLPLEVQCVAYSFVHASLPCAAMHCYVTFSKVYHIYRVWGICVHQLYTSSSMAEPYSVRYVVCAIQYMCHTVCAIPMACDLRSDETLFYLGGLTIWPSLAWNTRNICGGIFRILITLCSNHSLLRVGKIFLSLHILL